VTWPIIRDESRTDGPFLFILIQEILDFSKLILRNQIMNLTIYTYELVPIQR
jgi:hypothetical protein